MRKKEIRENFLTLKNERQVWEESKKNQVEEKENEEERERERERKKEIKTKKER